MIRRTGLDALIRPGSVAVLASFARDDGTGAKVAGNLRRGGFGGVVSLISDDAGAAGPMPVLARLCDLDHVPDCAIIALPPEAAVRAAEECAAAGVGAVALLSGGFGGTAADTPSWRDRLDGVARAGVRVLGPDSLGILTPATGWYGTPTMALAGGLPGVGKVAIVSQSGAVATDLVLRARGAGLGLSTVVTTGSEIDVEAGAVLRHLADDAETSVICMVIEAVRDADVLMEALMAARSAGKAVLVLKVGRSRTAQEAAASHTGALATEGAVFDGIARQFGALSVPSLEAMIRHAAAAAAMPVPRGDRVAVFTVSGGVGAIVADAAEAAGLALDPVPDAAQAFIRALLPDAATRNPVDLTSAASYAPDARGAEAIALTLDTGAYDAAICYFTNTSAMAGPDTPLRAALLALPRRFPDLPLVMCALVEDPVRRLLLDAGWGLADDPAVAVTLLAGRLGARGRRPPDPPVAKTAAGSNPCRHLDESEAKERLSAWGIPLPTEVFARDAEAALRHAERVGYPLVLKVVSPDIVHKTDVGGVRLGVAGRDALAEALARMRRSVAERASGARIEGFLLTPMQPDGVDMLVGARRDPTFGPIVSVGAGGVLVELLRDVEIRRAPVSIDEAAEMVDGLRVRRLLDGLRGTPAADLVVLRAAIVAVSRLIAQDGNVEAVEINPFRVFGEGRGAIALDASVTLRAGL